MLPCTSILATPAVAWATPALTPFTLPALYVITSVSDDTYVNISKFWLCPAAKSFA